MSNSCDPMDCSLPGSSIHGIFQARVLEWGAIAFSPGYWQVFKKVCMITILQGYAKLLQSSTTLCNPMVCSPLGPSVHGILQARIPEWVAMPSSRGSSRSRDQTCVSNISCIGRQVLFRSHHLGGP